MKIWNVCFLFLTISFLFETQAKAQVRSHEDSVRANIKPRAVMFRSLLVPGWGQAKNGQFWKIPIIYGTIAGLVVYNRYQAGLYEDYKAAHYNLQNPGGDQIFGPTPAYLSAYRNVNQLQTLRDSYRNQRDITYVYIALAYGFNALDAYIWAHLRMFDVSDNLSLAPGFVPSHQGVQSVLTARFTF